MVSYLNLRLQCQRQPSFISINRCRCIHTDCSHYVQHVCKSRWRRGRRLGRHLLLRRSRMRRSRVYALQKSAEPSRHREPRRSETINSPPKPPPGADPKPLRFSFMHSRVLQRLLPARHYTSHGYRLRRQPTLQHWRPWPRCTISAARRLPSSAAKSRSAIGISVDRVRWSAGVNLSGLY